MTELVNIPVTEVMDLSIDPIGVLRIPETMADKIAASMLATEWRLYASGNVVDGRLKLMTVSFAGVPCEKASDGPPKPKSPPIEIVRNNQTRIARRYRIVMEGGKFRIQKRGWRAWFGRRYLSCRELGYWWPLEFKQLDHAQEYLQQVIAEWVPVKETES